VALVGYTNSGKSTLMNRLTEAGVFVEDKLFATLDPTVRILRLPGGGEALLIDTVGFINKLPHAFVDAFKSTLEEVQSADLLLHVVDASSPLAASHIEVVEGVLRELGSEGCPRLTVLNKSDLLATRGQAPRVDGPWSLVSARTGDGVPQLLRQVGTLLAVQSERASFRIPVHRGDLLAEVRRAGRVASEELEDGFFVVTAYLPPKIAGRLRKALGEEVAVTC
jgi:GTP-binding protein HflX